MNTGGRGQFAMIPPGFGGSGEEQKEMGARGGQDDFDDDE